MINNPPSGKGESPANRLLSEKSPYLLQHAYNPVDWYPWGEEALPKPRTRISRSFSPSATPPATGATSWPTSPLRTRVAALLNQAFVCIKVDREERPDVDQLYMLATQIMTGRGGWPLTIIMTPEKKPFFAATYIPKRAPLGQAGMMELIPRVRDIWDSSR